MILEIIENIERPSNKIITELKKFRTAILSDALGKFGAMSHEIKPISDFEKIAGPAITVKLHVPDCLMCIKSIAVAKAGDIIVISVSGNKDRAVWGDLTSKNSKMKGLVGTIIDGAARDLEEMRKAGYPVFCRSITPSAGAAEYLGEINTDIECGGVNVSPGDIIIADVDGVVVIPKEKAEETLEMAKIISDAEITIEESIGKGKNIADILDIGQRLKEKKDEFIPQLETQKD